MTSWSDSPRPGDTEGRSGPNGASGPAMLASMNRVLVALAAVVVGSWLFPTSAVALPARASDFAAVVDAARAVPLAKGGKKKKSVEKPPPQEKAAPDGTRVDPRASTPPPEPPPPSDVGGRRGMRRIELDERLIQGQTNKANAIYLFERRESALRSLLKKRTDFHEEIDETLE